jgi:hypothetical protein
MDALTEIHRALGAGEIATDEASRLVDFVGRTTRVLAAKAVAVIDFADRLERCEEALILLLNAGRPGAAHEAASEVTQAAAEPVIDNNNTETMAPAADQMAAPVAEASTETPAIDNNNEITMEAAAALDEAVRSALPRRRESVKARLMNSVSPSALLVDVDPRKTAPVMPPQVPLTDAA